VVNTLFLSLALFGLNMVNYYFHQRAPQNSVQKVQTE